MMALFAKSKISKIFPLITPGMEYEMAHFCATLHLQREYVSFATAFTGVFLSVNWGQKAYYCYYGALEYHN